MAVDAPALETAADHLKAALKNGGNIVVFTGAGVSKESGIPTFRDAQTGLWASYDPQDLATREGFTQNPKLVWDWYDSRRNTVWDTTPNPAHQAIAELETLIETSYPTCGFTLITQNIDNLHRRAGSKAVLELHGNIFRYKCLNYGHPYSPELMPDLGEHRPPKCPHQNCNSDIRPDVVWFGEMLPTQTLEQAFTAAQEATVMLVVGTSGVVHPAASLPVVANEAGAVLIEVNPEPSELSLIMDCYLQGPAGKILPTLMTEN